ncbi:MAG: VOC family protein [Acidobacteriota bacterium]|nr:VOC family protein [Acidobacteriota bacterium]
MQKRRQPESLRLRAATPAITASDLQASVAWYRDVLGFTVDEEYEEDGVLRGVSLKAGDVVFLLTQDDFAKGRDRLKGLGLRFYCTTAQDVDVLAAEIGARGGELAQAPTDQPWGSRDFAVVDPDGFAVSISSEIGGRPPPAED